MSDKFKELARKPNVLMETIEQVENPIVGFVLKATCAKVKQRRICT